MRLLAFLVAIAGFALCSWLIHAAIAAGMDANNALELSLPEKRYRDYTLGGTNYHAEFTLTGGAMTPAVMNSSQPHYFATVNLWRGDGDKRLLIHADRPCEWTPNGCFEDSIETLLGVVTTTTLNATNSIALTALTNASPSYELFTIRPTPPPLTIDWRWSDNLMKKNATTYQLGFRSDGIVVWRSITTTTNTQSVTNSPIEATP